MMIDKTKLGIEFFDETFGGIYRGRPVFCYGRRDSGKSVIASYFLHQAFLDGDRSLLLTDWQAKDALIVAEAVGVPFTHMVRTGNLTILEYSSFIPGVEMCADSPLPPTAFIELQKIIVARSIRRVVLDTALPWLAIHPIERMPGHVYSFIHALIKLYNILSFRCKPRARLNLSNFASRRLDLSFDFRVIYTDCFRIEFIVERVVQEVGRRQ